MQAPLTQVAPTPQAEPLAAQVPLTQQLPLGQDCAQGTEPSGLVTVEFPQLQEARMIPAISQAANSFILGIAVRFEFVRD